MFRENAIRAARFALLLFGASACGSGKTPLADEIERTRLVFGNALPVVIEERQVQQSIGVPLLGSLSVPCKGLPEILRNSFAMNVAEPEGELGGGKSLFGCLAIPLRSRRKVGRDASSGLVKYPEAMLRGGITLIGGLSVPHGGLRRVLGDTRPQFVLGSDLEFRFGVAGVGFRHQGRVAAASRPAGRGRTLAEANG